MPAVKVLVVDDSTTMRALFSNALDRHKDIVVVGAANGAAEAAEMIEQYHPDVMTLDVEMPGKTGLEFLEEIMATRPMRVVMLSTLTQKGADVTLRALDLGAVDCFPKPARVTPDEFEKVSAKLCKTVLTAAKTNLDVRKPGGSKAITAAAVPTIDYLWDGSLLVVAGGVGGVEAAQEMLAPLPINCPPTIVLLAVDEGIGMPFAAQLEGAIKPNVKLAADGAKLEPGVVHVVVDPAKHAVIDRWPEGTLRLVDRDPVNGIRPSADLLLGSIARTAGAQTRAVMLSGDGADGAAGMAALHAAGARCFVQTPETALVRQIIDAVLTREPAIRTAVPRDLALAAIGSRAKATA